jgi:hypothetical protein
MPFQHPSEEFVYRVCHHSFLSLWSYPNPLHPNRRRELCDVLVVCDPHVVLFSVKAAAFQPIENDEVAQARWLRKVVDGSVDQLYGAERALPRLQRVILSDGTEGVPLPEQATVHRVAVSLGGQGAIPLPFGDFGKGFVHVVDESTFWILLHELDTISDFVDYLSAKEQLYSSGHRILCGSEQDLMAVYVDHGRKFPDERPDIITVAPGSWEQLNASAAYQRRVAADASSRAWDDIIEYLIKENLEPPTALTDPTKDGEKVLRTMARERRFHRRLLTDTFRDFLDLAGQHRVRARTCVSPSGVRYVFFNSPADASRDVRQAELSMRCFVARSLAPEAQVVVGIGTNRQPAPLGYATDVVYLEVPEWTAEHQAQAEVLKRELDLFATPIESSWQVDEYPPE